MLDDQSDVEVLGVAGPLFVVRHAVNGGQDSPIVAATAASVSFFAS